MMLDPVAVRVAERLLAIGVPKAEIARRVGISRTSVRRIADGSRPEPPEPPAPVREVDVHRYRRVPTYRCPTCKGSVYLKPCPLCHVRGDV